ncbi:hypothetical protein BBK36DRAFT_1111938, partial [Trichoderma citrinoviride]
KEGKKQKEKTYNSRCSLVVTHPTTNLPVSGLSMGEQTGPRVFHYLWSYVLAIRQGKYISQTGSKPGTCGYLLDALDIQSIELVVVGEAYRVSTLKTDACFMWMPMSLYTAIYIDDPKVAVQTAKSS